MALIIDFPDKTDDICKDAYIVINPTIDNILKNGNLGIMVYRSKEYRKSNKHNINYVNIPIKEKELFQDKENIEKSDVVTQLSYNDFAWKTGNETYKKIKTLKIESDNKIIDFSLAKDDL